MLFDKVDELVVVDSTGTHDHHILTKIVSLVVLNNHVARDLADVINVAKDRLSHHVLAVYVVVNVFHEGFLRVLIHSFKLLPYCVLFQLNVIAILGAIAEHITYNFDGARDSIREAQSMVHSMFSACISIELGSRVFNFHLELPSSAIFSALEVQVL